MSIKITPDIRFVYDPTMDRAMRLEELLDNAKDD
jgi:ribosome-binding factor A